MPDWLPPWNDQSARQAKLEEQCPHHRVPTGYANATLCGNNEFSPLLAASMTSGLAPTPCSPCVYNPVPADGDDAVTAWRFDQDNQCWMQVGCAAGCRLFWLALLHMHAGGCQVQVGNHKPPHTADDVRWSFVSSSLLCPSLPHCRTRVACSPARWTAALKGLPWRPPCCGARSSLPTSWGARRCRWAFLVDILASGSPSGWLPSLHWPLVEPSHAAPRAAHTSIWHHAYCTSVSAHLPGFITAPQDAWSAFYNKGSQPADEFDAAGEEAHSRLAQVGWQLRFGRGWAGSWGSAGRWL